jgi:CheY-like chemotaxis protein
MEIHSAGSGEEALERAASTVYDIVFMDHMMEGMDGIEAAAALRKIENFAGTPVIALTANAIRGMKDFYLEKGFQDYLSKPINSQSLDEVLARWIPAERRTKLEEAKAETVKKEPSQVSASITLELEAQRFDMLKHYRWHFENRLAVDTVYFEQFTALVESLETARQDEELKKQAALLTEAGRRGDLERIREILPAFYEALKERRREALKKGKEEVEAEQKTLLGILPNLKKTLAAGETEASEALMGELGTATLGQEGRELYFLLYDLLLSGDTEKALGAISLWEKLPHTGAGG